jgi:hypothetical protein
MSAKRVFLTILTALVLGAGASPAIAATPAPGFTIDSEATPTNFSASDNASCLSTELQGNSFVAGVPCDAYIVNITNAGSKPTNGEEVAFADVLPKGLEVQEVRLFWPALAPLFEKTKEENIFPTLEGLGFCSTTPLRCSVPFSVAPEETVKMVVFVTVEPGAPSELVNTASVSGGGAAEVSASQGNANSPTPASFGLANFDFHIDGVNGARDTQAGDHPYELTTTIDLNNTSRIGVEGSSPITTSVEDVKDVVVDLPLGFAGSTLAAPECTLTLLDAERCPSNTVVGHLFAEPQTMSAVNSPIWNLAPERGVPAEFGYIDVDHGSHVFYAHVVPTPAGYVLQVTNPDIPQVDLTHIVATFYGDPAERAAELQQHTVEREVGHPVEREHVSTLPFFTDPTDCSGGEPTASIHIDSWLHPGRVNADGTPDFSDPAWVGSESKSPPVTGCNELQFDPELKAQPTTNVADSPSGLDFELKLPQTEDAGVHATPALKNAAVTLPEGMTVDPSAGNGLGACSVSQIGWLGGSPFNFSPARPECPESSKIGTLELTTPLIPGTLTGAMYLARQNENPFNSVLAAYVVVDDPITGVLLKIAGEFKPDPHTGRITALFAENPQLPFSDLKLHFFGGPRAELTTPENCGTFTTASDLAPWSAPDSGPDAMPFDNFTIESGCVNGFAPAFSAGSTNLQAGAYTPFVASFSRQDTDQELGGLSVSLPPGLLANVGSVPLCGEAQANAGTCPESTQVGTVQAGAGPGPNPLFETGKAYLTGPYNGGPYGLSVVVPAVAGPFNFGVVVVRQSLRIDPTDAHVTDVSDPFPTILDVTGVNGQTIGIPIRLRRVDVSIDRPGFTFNPTNCAKLAVGGSITSTQSASSSLAVPFQVTNCATLKFAPKFSVSTTAKSSKANGTSLVAKLSYPNAPQGTYANIARVKVELPKQLPSRLTTLQKACTATQFNTNPAGCPSASLIGHAVVHTPILPAPLTGPAIFVSHGGEAFPSLTMVLQGDGVTVDLVGTTFISKTGVTSTTFKTVPDTPFSTFELTLPEGRYSALTALGNLCTQKLRMPTEFLAQNGAAIHQTTPVSVTGCAKKKSLTRAQKLAAALKACHKKARGKRASCERAARKKYGPIKRTKEKKGRR